MPTTTGNNTFSKLYASNQGSLGAISDLTPTATAPSGDGVFDMRSGYDVWSGVKLVFFGTDTADQTFTARVFAWYAVGLSSVTQWVPVHLMDVLVTLGTTTGTANGLGTSALFADTIAVSGTPTIESSAYVIQSPASNRVALLKIDPAGAQKIQVKLGTTATAVTANVLAAGF